MNLWESSIQAVQAWIPDVTEKIVVDPFRIMGLIGKPRNTARRQEPRVGMASGDEARKRRTDWWRDSREPVLERQREEWAKRGES